MMEYTEQDYSKVVEAMKACGLTDATGPLYDLKFDLDGPLPETIKLDFTATAPDKVCVEFFRQVYVSGIIKGSSQRAAQIRSALGIRD